MEIDWYKVRRIILDDRWRRIYKPDKSAIRKITGLYPDCRIVGFGFDKHTGFWALLVEWQAWGANPWGITQNVFLSKYKNAS